jgi:hypothetical protein
MLTKPSHYLFVADLFWFHQVALLALMAYPLLGHISLNRTLNMEVAHHALGVLLEHRHVRIGRFA